MAYFGDATAHAAILGVALLLAMGISVLAGAAALAMGLAVGGLSGRSGWAVDTLLGVAAHSAPAPAPALGLVAVSFVSGVRIDLLACLLGGVLPVSREDLAVIRGGAGRRRWARRCGGALTRCRWRRWTPTRRTPPGSTRTASA